MARDGSCMGRESWWGVTHGDGRDFMPLLLIYFSHIEIPLKNSIKKLVVDLLIQTMGARLVGHLDCIHVIPMIASNSSTLPPPTTTTTSTTTTNPAPLTTALQVYLVPSSSPGSPSYTLLQLRSSIVKLKGAAMCRALINDWISKAMFRDLVIVGGLDASGRVDDEITG